MYLVAIAWLYVVVLMALAEGFAAGGSWLGAFFTLAALRARARSIALYLIGTPARRAARAAARPPQRAPAIQTAAAIRPVTPSRRNEKNRDGVADGAPVAALDARDAGGAPGDRAPGPAGRRATCRCRAAGSARQRSRRDRPAPTPNAASTSAPTSNASARCRRRARRRRSAGAQPAASHTRGHRRLDARRRRGRASRRARRRRRGRRARRAAPAGNRRPARCRRCRARS